MAKKKCNWNSTEHIVAYCDEEECAAWNEEVGECDPCHLRIFFTYLEAMFEEILP